MASALADCSATWLGLTHFSHLENEREKGGKSVNIDLRLISCIGFTSWSLVMESCLGFYLGFLSWSLELNFILVFCLGLFSLSHSLVSFHGLLSWTFILAM